MPFLHKNKKHTDQTTTANNDQSAIPSAYGPSGATGGAQGYQGQPGPGVGGVGVGHSNFTPSNQGQGQHFHNQSADPYQTQPQTAQTQGGLNQNDPNYIPPTNHFGSGSGGGSSMTGKMEHTIGSLVGSQNLKAKGIQKEQEAAAFKAQSTEIAEAERLEREAMLRRERAVQHGAHPDNKRLGGILSGNNSGGGGGATGNSGIGQGGQQGYGGQY
ncbi:hypothetical protein ABKN59_011179 [Abortiporus biennis]